MGRITASAYVERVSVNSSSLNVQSLNLLLFLKFPPVFCCWRTCENWRKKNSKEHIKLFGDMGSCCSTSVKASPLQDGYSEHGDNMDMANSNVSSNVVASTLPAEGEILESPNLKSFLLSELKAATGDFKSDCLLGEGAFGCVYKGWIDMPETGMAIAVKMLNPKSAQGQQEWLAEIIHLGQLQHPNVVKLIGYCLEDYYRLLVYEFMPNGSLEDHLFEGASNFQPIPWDRRIKVALGAAKGLAFLHKTADVIHRDFKTSDILLDLNFNAKISDFGLAKCGPTDGRSHVTTRAISTGGYAAPEYIGTGHVSTRSDVYSFGVVLLELLTGKRAIDYQRPPGEQNLIEWARTYLNNKRKVYKLLDVGTPDQLSPTAAQLATKLVVRCLLKKPKFRPNMVEVVKELEEIRNANGNGRSTAPRN